MRCFFITFILLFSGISFSLDGDSVGTFIISKYSVNEAKGQIHIQPDGKIERANLTCTNHSEVILSKTSPYYEEMKFLILDAAENKNPITVHVSMKQGDCVDLKQRITYIEVN